MVFSFGDRSGVFAPETTTTDFVRPEPPSAVVNQRVPIWVLHRTPRRLLIIVLLDMAYSISKVSLFALMFSIRIHGLNKEKDRTKFKIH
ncbi:hypothetical protein Lal_00029998, partial [Lupinus albus]